MKLVLCLLLLSLVNNKQKCMIEEDPILEQALFKLKCETLNKTECNNTPLFSNYGDYTCVWCIDQCIYYSGQKEFQDTEYYQNIECKNDITSIIHRKKKHKNFIFYIKFYFLKWLMEFLKIPSEEFCNI